MSVDSTILYGVVILYLPDIQGKGTKEHVIHREVGVYLGHGYPVGIALFRGSAAGVVLVTGCLCLFLSRTS